jgi:hypothetical protein
VDLLDSVVDRPGAVARAPAGDQEAAGVDPHALALFLTVNIYLREAYRVPTADVWPPAEPGGSGQQEPSSPMKMTSRGWTRDKREWTHSYGCVVRPTAAYTTF